ncbi:MAG: chain length-determining protein, partial [Phycisphaerales bacterium]|nr:chain length-determining protein [Phycisphaerales bacterium]
MNDIVEQVFGYLRGIWRNRWYAMVCAWVVCVLGWAVVCILPDQYQASARVSVDTKTILRPLLEGLTVDLNPNAQIELITRTLFSRPNLEKIAQLTKLDLQNPDPEAREQMLIQLQQRINLTKSGPDLYTILYEDPDPQLAKRMVETVVGVFERNLVGNTQQSTDTAQRFLDEQIKEYERRLIEAEDRLK